MIAKKTPRAIAIEILLYISIPIAGMFFLFWLISNNNPHEAMDIQIVIFDDSFCEGPGYVVEMEEKTVSISGDQVGRENTGNAKFESQINISPLPREDGWFTYVFKAKYENCPDLTSEERRVKPGWYIYEFIRNGEIMHKVRNKYGET
ncbi:MAG: hypothetical protein ABW092_19695 [Candidatus Thiodiazotropha sp.]